jgi:phage terminase large subunit-like protein
MTKQEYIDRHYELLDSYVHSVLEGNRPANTYEYKAVERYINDLERNELEFNHSKFEHLLKFLYYVRINIKGRPSRFILQPFQTFIVANIYGFYWKNSGKRRFRYAYLEMARKGGKTTLNAALSLYHLTKGAELDAQVLLTASSSKQAGIALKYAKSIIRNSPALKKRVIERSYYLKYKTQSTDNQLETLAYNPEKADGYSPSFCLVDEVHAHPDDEMIGVIKSGIMARENPLVVYITTAGFNLESPAYEFNTVCKRILKGEAQDDAMFTMIFTLDKDDDWQNPENWIKANPNLGVIIDLDDLLIEYNQALNNPTQIMNFKTKNLNLWEKGSDLWIEDEFYRECFFDGEDDLTSDAWDCYAGLDMSSQRDLTSIVLLFYNKVENRFAVKPYFFFPQNDKRRIRQSGLDLGKWIEKGYINEIFKPYIDEDDLFSFFEKLHQKYNIKSLGYDEWNAIKFVNKVILNTSIECNSCAQTTKFFNMPIKMIERVIIDERIAMSRNPVLRFCFRNVVMYTDGNGNRKPLKNKSQDSIDGAVALLNAMGEYLSHEFNEEGSLLEKWKI